MASDDSSQRRQGTSAKPIIPQNSEKSSAFSKKSLSNDEIVEVSEKDAPYHTQSDGHGWLDANGWLHRKAYVINAKNGSIYQITMDIAKAKDGRTILYALNGKTKKVGNAEVNSIVVKPTRGSSQNSNLDTIIPQKAEKSSAFSKKSLSNEGEAPVKYGNFNISGEDVRLEAPAAKKIHIISARKIKSGNGQVLNVKSDDSPQPTSETLLDGITATNSITDFDGKVNTSYEKISETGDPEGSANEKKAKVLVGKSKTEKRKNRVWEN